MKLGLLIFGGVCLYIFIAALLQPAGEWFMKKIDSDDPDFHGATLAAFWAVVIPLSIPVGVVVSMGIGGYKLGAYIRERSRLRKKRKIEQETKVTDDLKEQVMAALKIDGSRPVWYPYETREEAAAAYQNGSLSASAFLDMENRAIGEKVQSRP